MCPIQVMDIKAVFCRRNTIIDPITTGVGSYWTCFSGINPGASGCDHFVVYSHLSNPLYRTLYDIPVEILGFSSLHNSCPPYLASLNECDTSEPCIRGVELYLSLFLNHPPRKHRIDSAFFRAGTVAYLFVLATGAESHPNTDPYMYVLSVYTEHEWNDSSGAPRVFCQYPPLTLSSLPLSSNEDFGNVPDPLRMECCSTHIYSSMGIHQQFRNLVARVREINSFRKSSMIPTLVPSGMESHVITSHLELKPFMIWQVRRRTFHSTLIYSHLGANSHPAFALRKDQTSGLGQKRNKALHYGDGSAGRIRSRAKPEKFHIHSIITAFIDVIETIVTAYNDDPGVNPREWPPKTNNMTNYSIVGLVVRIDITSTTKYSHRRTNSIWGIPLIYLGKHAYACHHLGSPQRQKWRSLRILRSIHP
ncbi:hypothetical protein AG1IA_06793 [Rhizoctonia solani AG-1 IA]|uniref:Uncharacterized protein n=1 Tax=Thanatephorus cucumeris (strain AG1-IA) TaxID=983506 RepID=L8WLX7_THACA|nr:hypothetical protein AG1IA_06793 [Rhizoctonia solani AG-1 IA]